METVNKILQDVEQLRHIPYGEKCICLFSGGKDSVLALAMAIEQGAQIFELVHSLNSDTNLSAWHKQSHEIARKQALELNMNINIVPSGVFQNKTHFIRLLKKYKNMGIKYVVCGDVLEGDQSLLEITYCLIAGLKPVMPIWKRTNEEILNLIERHKIEAIITYIEDEKQIDTKWIGKKYNRDFFEQLKRTNVDEIGEDGEFHTTVIDASIFRKRLEVIFGKIKHTNQGIIMPLKI